MANSKKDETVLVTGNSTAIDETALFERVVEIIEKRKFRAASYVNSEITPYFYSWIEFIGMSFVSSTAI